MLWQAEILYPPLTYLEPTGRKETVHFDEGDIAPQSPPQTFGVLEVEAHV